MISADQSRAVAWLAKNNGLLRATPGAGKTRTVLYMLEKTRERALILAPATVARRTWQDEAEKIGISGRVVQYCGAPTTRMSLMHRLQQESRPHIVCSYELASECTARYADLFDIIIFDEVTRLRNPKSKRYRAIRNNTGIIKRRIGLTGTPAPNHYHQLYGSLQITAGLPMLYEQWLKQYFERRIMHTPNGPKVRYVDGPDSVKAVTEWLIPKSYKMPAGYCGEVRTIDHWVGVPKAAQLEVTMDNRVRARQLAQGRVYKKDDYEAWNVFHHSKQTKLEEILSELNGEPALMFYQFRHDIDAIQTAADEAQCASVAIPATPNQLSKLLPDWDAKNINALVVHPASAGHGLNLQKGSRTVIWYGLPEDAELYQQGMKRIDRQGQTEAVMNHRILAECEIDRLLVEMLETKRQKLADLVS